MIFISTFIAGTKDIVADRLIHDLHARILELYDSLVIYETRNQSRPVEGLRYLNNSFILIKKLTHHKSFETAVNEICSITDIPNYKRKQRCFRVMFSDENSFAAVSDKTRQKVELFISHKTKLCLNRSNPDIEYWLIKDRAGMYFAQRITKKNAMNGLKKGQLRPELADIMCYLASIHKNDVVYDPFCGYGAIPGAAIYYSPKKIICGDIDINTINHCRKTLTPDANHQTELQIENMDIFKNETPAGITSVNKIITDPPWGMFDKSIDTQLFYKKLFLVMDSILTINGAIVILLSRDVNIDEIDTLRFTVKRDYKILVNGKKAIIYVME